MQMKECLTEIYQLWLGQYNHSNLLTTMGMKSITELVVTSYQTEGIQAPPSEWSNTPVNVNHLTCGTSYKLCPYFPYAIEH